MRKKEKIVFFSVLDSKFYSNFIMSEWNGMNEMENGCEWIMRRPFETFSVEKKSSTKCQQNEHKKKKKASIRDQKS